MLLATSIMPDLPPGWRVNNAAGTFAGPPVVEQSQTNDTYVDSGDNSDTNHVGSDNELNIGSDSTGWQDRSPDEESISVQCLLCEHQFPTPILMLAHCASAHDFDFLAIAKEQSLDYYGVIRFVNYIRRNVQNGVPNPTAVASFDDLKSGEELLKPVLEGDALLYSIDDIISFDETNNSSAD